MKQFLALLILLCVSSSTFSQQYNQQIQDYLQSHQEEFGLTTADISNWKVTDEVYSKQTDITHVHIVQTHKGLPIHNAVANFNIHEGEVLSMGNRLIKNAALLANGANPALNPIEAIKNGALALAMKTDAEPRILEAKSSTEFVMSASGISRQPIPLKLMYQPMPEGELMLAWDMEIDVVGSNDWWSMRVDANSGNFLHKFNYTVYCEFPDKPHTGHADLCPEDYPKVETQPAPLPLPKITAAEEYRVYAPPVESPNHGARTLEVNPAIANASPFGWHDTNGSAGAEYTITRGNNVFAYEDAGNNNGPGYSPNAGNSLHFDYALNLNQAPSNYYDPAITNLFYWNNIMHDLWYQYGFDEASGNFQENNYNNGGSASDPVNAEAQDGGGTNNANFATPTDGNNPRMQMYLWTGGSGFANYLTVNSPQPIAGSYQATDATFGPGVPVIPVTADVVLAEDGTPPINDICEPITNGAAVNGKIALIDRMTCTFVSKIEEAQAKGAVAVIIVNNVAGAPVTMGGTSNTITIPSIMVSDVDGALIKNSLQNGPVNATIVNPGGNFDKDGDFDNAIIAHEYGHGISTRLTGGRNNSSCLQNAEQMGEGWSDYFGMVMTIESGDLSTDVRGVGTYATGQPTNGVGIRNAPYSTDFNVNNFTYADVADAGNVSQPHGIGFVWCTMLWDLTWALIDQYGWDPNLYTGTGGNNISMNLVTNGLKLQPCSPGFVDGRDAILQADMNLYGGVNQCLIWEAFAARGLGFSATQGSSASRSDQSEAYDLPPACNTPTQAPTADFAFNVSSACDGGVTFTDNSGNIPQSWAWDFGDGGTSTLPNPTHTYVTGGTFTVTLIASNAVGADTTTQQVTITFPTSPTTIDGEGCENTSIGLSANGTSTLFWYDQLGNQVATGPTYNTPQLGNTTVYTVRNGTVPAPQKVGPVNGSFGGGGYHGNAPFRTINFTADVPLEIVSVWVDTQASGIRTFYLWDAADAGGNIVQQKALNVGTGGLRVLLNFNVPSAGNYSLGLADANMFRNNSGVSFPYTLPGVISLTSSSAGTGFYYYLYDWEIQEGACLSPAVPVTAMVFNPSFTSVVGGGNSVTFTDASTGATSWAWDFGDGNSSTVQNPTHTYSAPGTYTVTLTINGIACTFTDTVNTGTINIDHWTQSTEFSLLPNPASSSTSLHLSQAAITDVDVRIVDLHGRTMIERVLPAGETVIEIDITTLSSAVYLVEIVAGPYKIVEKLAIAR